MTDGLLIGLAVGIVTCWFFYWRAVKLFARIGIGKEDVWKGMLGKQSYSTLLGLRARLDEEIARRQVPQEPDA